MTNFFTKVFKPATAPAFNASSSVATIDTLPSNIPLASDRFPSAIRQDILSFTPAEPIEKVNLKDYGHEQSSVSRGDLGVLVSNLNRIFHGHLVDINQNEEEIEQRKKDKEKLIDELQKQQIDLKQEKLHLESNDIPSKDNHVKKKEEELHLLKVDHAEQKKHSNWNAGRFWMYLTLVSFLSIYLIFFYMNVIYAAFFRNILAEAAVAGSEDIGIILNSLFTTKIFETSPGIMIFLIVGTFVFFTLGWLPHIMKEKYKGKWIQTPLIMLTGAASLILEGFFAYKIHENILLVSGLIGQEVSDSVWYTSVNFWLVIFMGFLVYVAWAFMIESCFEIWAQRENKEVLNLKSDMIKQQIDHLKEEILKLKQRVSVIEASIQKTVIDASRLKEEIQGRAFDSALVIKNLESFFGGWVIYLSSMDYLKDKVQTSREVFDKFIVENKLGSTQTSKSPSLLLNLLLLLMLTIGISFNNLKAQPAKIQENMVVLIDLSDRVMEKDQCRKDKELIMVAFEQFFETVQKSHLFIQSNDAFSISTIYQKGTHKAISGLLERMSLNLANIPIQLKRKKAEEFKANLGLKLDTLYSLAFRGNLSKNYPGCDIWKHFNEQLRYQLKRGYQNKVLLLTDGYFDFEDYAHTKNVGNKQTSSKFLSELKGPEWKTVMQKKGYGILPVKLQGFQLQVCVFEIKSKKPDDLDELDKLKYMWEQFLIESGNKNFHLQPTGNYQISKDQLKQKF